MASQSTAPQAHTSTRRSRSTVQRYLDAIGIDASIPPRLHSFGLLQTLPIGEKRLAQLTAELNSAHPELIPTPDQCWLYQLALQLVKQEILYDNLCLPRVEKRNPEFERFLRSRDYREKLYQADRVKYRDYAAKRRAYTGIRQTYPSLLDSMCVLTAEQTRASVQQITMMLRPVEFTLLLKLYRDHDLQKTAAIDLKISPTEATKCKQRALRKLRQEWHGLWQVLTVDPRLSEVARTHSADF